MRGTIKGGYMKTMTCKQLGGACDKKFHAETFDEMAELSKNHGMEMMEKGDPDHLEAMDKMPEHHIRIIYWKITFQ